jgi:glycosyltransferase involved in cell wall biosynthesis
MIQPGAAEVMAVMPIYNEEANVRTVITEWLSAFGDAGVNARLLAVNDGSRDRTLAILRELETKFSNRLIVIDKPNSGHGPSCRVGYEFALGQNATWVLQIDSDGQCDPVFFPSFWNQRNQADCIFGLRITREDGFLRKLISQACTRLTSLLTGCNLKDANVPYRLIRRSALEDALRLVPKDFDIQNVALTVVLKRNPTLRWVYVPIRFRARQGGTNSINLPKIAKMGLRMLGQIRQIKK